MSNQQLLLIVVAFIICFGYYTSFPRASNTRYHHKRALRHHVTTTDEITHDEFHHPIMTHDDIIYDSFRNTVPVVNEEYRVIFFQVAKAASSEWLRFFMRLNNDPRWCSNGGNIHDNKSNGLKYLSDYTLEEAQEMMTDPKWTKAIFVRDPKPRILSSFLDKAIEHSNHFIQNECRNYWLQDNNFENCLNYHEHYDFFLYQITTTLQDNVHWRSIYSRIDEKWWPYINHVGYMENLSDDAKAFLQSIHSSVSGISAWDKIGTTGWSDNERSCEATIGSEGHFLAARDTKHATNARDKLLSYYTPKLERFVEAHYADDYDNPYFEFDPLKLYDDNDGSKTERFSKEDEEGSKLWFMQ